jgi:hypothetical protein
MTVFQQPVSIADCSGVYCTTWGGFQLLAQVSPVGEASPGVPIVARFPSIESLIFCEPAERMLPALLDTEHGSTLSAVQYEWNSPGDQGLPA